MASGDVFAIKLLITSSGQECQPGFYLTEGAGVGPGDPVSNVAGYVANIIFAGGGFAGFAASTSLHGVLAQDIKPATGRSRTGFSSGVVGDIADDNPVPPQDSMLIEWTSDLKGGKGKWARRSRTYMPGIYSTGQISGFLIPDLQDALSAFASILFDEFVNDATAYQLTNVSFVPGSNPRVIRETHPVTQFAVDNVVAIQRSRRPGRGI